jgi:hypothetical protein
MTDITYQNLFTNEPATYNPIDHGFFTVVFNDDFDGTVVTSNGGVMNISLSFGAISGPQPNLALAHRDWVDLLDNYPELEDRLELVILPCVHSSRDGWVRIADEPNRRLADTVSSDDKSLYFQ